MHYAKERVQFSKPIASFQLVQKKFADQEQDKMSGAMASLAKMNNARRTEQICTDARDIIVGRDVIGIRAFK